MKLLSLNFSRSHHNLSLGFLSLQIQSASRNGTNFSINCRSAPSKICQRDTSVSGTGGLWQKSALTANSSLGTVGGRGVSSEAQESRHSLPLVKRSAQGASRVCGQAGETPAPAGPSHVLSCLLPSYCCHSFPLKGRDVGPPLCGTMQSSEDRTRTGTGNAVSAAIAKGERCRVGR